MTPEVTYIASLLNLAQALLTYFQTVLTVLAYHHVGISVEDYISYYLRLCRNFRLHIGMHVEYEDSGIIY